MRMRGAPESAGDRVDVLVDDLHADDTDASRDPARIRPVSHDASHFLLTPSALVVPRDTDELARTIRAAARHGVTVTMRSGGTSLSGQAVTDGLLVDGRRHFRDIEVLDSGRRVRVQPGATVRAVNARLLRHGRKLGPDPSSEIACTIGGVIANNSSGMLCGTAQNSYRTLESAVLVLASGDAVDTGAPDADARLRAVAPDLASGLERLRDRIRGNAAWKREIERQFAIKNTMGYGLNAFLDHDGPAELLARLVVGSEGTLAAIAEATFATVPRHPHAATSLLVFENVGDATDALPALVAAGLGAIELLDATSLRVAARSAATPDRIRNLDVRQHAALLIEHEAPAADELADAVAATEAVLRRLPIASGGDFTSDPRERVALWSVRKGLYAAVAGARPVGTTALLEDIAVPVDRLAETCAALDRLFARFEYRDAVIFGHAKDGNVHFLVNERFDDPARADAYAGFTDELVDLVLDRGGTLKAEHGTGRIMAPFVERQYGPALTEVMREVKRLADPGGVLNPGIVLTDDPQAHVRHLKPDVRVEPEVDRCVECGYCEPVCPSRNLTLTPRQRIVARRELALAEAGGDDATATALRGALGYDTVDTCAVDGMCETACPVGINTGDLVRRLRTDRATPAEAAAWNAAATGWGTLTRAAGVALSAADRLPAPLVGGATRVGRAVLGDDRVPRYTGDLPGGGRRRPRRDDGEADAVLFASCTSTMFAAPGGGAGPGAALLALCDRAGVRLRTPQGLDALCCGTPWKSKGLRAGAETMASRVITALFGASDEGRLPIVVDASSCAEGLGVLLDRDDARAAGLTVIDGTSFVAERVLPRLRVRRRAASLTVHPTCADTRLGAVDAVRVVADAVADAVHVPVDWACCGFAGDRGMLHPELTASATEAEASEVERIDAEAHASTNRTCELGMTRASGRTYEHVLELLERATR